MTCINFLTEKTNFIYTHDSSGLILPDKLRRQNPSKIFESSLNSFLCLISNELTFIPYSDPTLLLRQLKIVFTCSGILYLWFVKSLGLDITSGIPIFFFQKSSNIPFFLIWTFRFISILRIDWQSWPNLLVFTNPRFFPLIKKILSSRAPSCTMLLKPSANLVRNE